MEKLSTEIHGSIPFGSIPSEGTCLIKVKLKSTNEEFSQTPQHPQRVSL